MTKLRFTMQTLALSVFMLALASLAQAQATRTWVSGVGDDVNPCSRTAPCKTWAGAISKTAAGGEIDALDPGGFGTLTINKSLTVDGTAGQGFGSTLNSGGFNGFVINDALTASPGTSKVVLRNLSINGAGTTLGADGIRILQALSVLIENTTISNGTGDGIDVSESNDMQVTVRNTRINNFTNGIRVGTSSGLAKMTIEGGGISHCTKGILASSRSRVTAKGLTISHCTTGIHTEGQTAGNGGAEAVVTLEDSQLAFMSGNALQAGGGLAASSSIIRISNNMVVNSGAAVSIQANGSVDTWANNRFSGNSDNTCTGCSAAQPFR
ncbi:MAG TPA: right-handed parallel beta-helix repeat-containing protein [Pyrinomonadaceae bacterium]